MHKQKTNCILKVEGCILSKVEGRILSKVEGHIGVGFCPISH